MSKNRPELDAAIESSVAIDDAGTSARRTAQLSAQLSRARKEVAYLTRELSRSEEQVNTLLALDEHVPVVPTAMLTPAAGNHPATFALLCSDWHVGETVLKPSVSGRNEYNPQIASKRVDKLIEGALWMIEAWRAGKSGYGWNMDTAVIWLGGDFMSGHIHDDLRESNALSPTQEILFAEDLICRMLDTLVTKGKFKNIVCPTSYGNHARTNKETRVSTGWSTSYEWMMYQNLAKLYNGKGRVSIRTGKDEISRLDVHGHALRFSHGDSFKFGGGVGGITVPGKKWVAKLDATEPASVTCCGHWHQFLALPELLVNNCLIGWGPYSQRVAPFSRASQTAFIVDAKYGYRMPTEIFVQ